MQYMWTSGERSPLQHKGHEALEPAVPHLTGAEFAEAERRVRAARAVDEKRIRYADDIAGIYGPIEAAFAARRKAAAGK